MGFSCRPVSYEVTVDGQVAGRTNNTNYESRDLWVGTHSMTVKAVDSSGSLSAQSRTVKIQVTGAASNGGAGNSGGIAQVQGLRATERAGRDVQWNWNAVSGAAQYEVTVDGKVAGRTPSTQWMSESLWAGEHSLTVRAVNGAGAKSQQSDTLNELVFSDEFNGTALNPYRWHSQLRWDGEWNGERYEYRIINGEDQFYVNVLSPDPEHQREIVPVYNPFKFNGSTLRIQAARNPLRNRVRTRTHGKLDDIVVQQPFLSGAISTHEKFAQKYGYFEARIKIPSHVGTFPAFWLFHARRAWEGTQRTEIDIMENLGHAPHYIYNSFHYFKNVTSTYSGDANFIKPKPSGQIFTGIVGRPGDQRYPTDNDINIFKNPSLEIDYVRVYKRK